MKVCEIYNFFPWWDGKHPPVRQVLLSAVTALTVFLNIKVTEIRSITCFSGPILEAFQDVAKQQPLPERLNGKVVTELTECVE